MPSQKLFFFYACIFIGNFKSRKKSGNYPFISTIITGATFFPNSDIRIAFTFSLIIATNALWHMVTAKIANFLIPATYSVIIFCAYTGRTISYFITFLIFLKRCFYAIYSSVNITVFLRSIITIMCYFCAFCGCFYTAT